MKLEKRREVYVGNVKPVSRIGKYYYSVAKIGEIFHICIQQIGDIGWLVKHEEFNSSEAAVAQIKFTEKEHYDAVKDKRKAHT